MLRFVAGRLQPRQALFRWLRRKHEPRAALDLVLQLARLPGDEAGEKAGGPCALRPARRLADDFYDSGEDVAGTALRADELGLGIGRLDLLAKAPDLGVD